MRLLEKERFKFFRGQKGISLLETIIGLGIFGVVGVALLHGLTTSSNAVMMSQENVAAESLAKSQVEYIKIQDYILVDDYDPITNCYDKIDIPADLAVGGYDIEISSPVVIINPDLGPFELQSIVVIIKRNSEVVLTISIYKYGSASL